MPERNVFLRLYDRQAQIKYIICDNEESPMLFDSHIRAIDFWVEHRDKFAFPASKPYTSTIPNTVTDGDADNILAVIKKKLASKEMLPLTPLQQYLFWGGDRNHNATYSGGRIFTITIECRKTKRGASTHTIPNSMIRIMVHSASKTGNHWCEDIAGREGTEFAVKDVSNSGKHHCWAGRIDSTAPGGYRIIRRMDGRCNICD